MRLIDADVLKQHIDKLPALPDGNFAGNHSALKALINMQPTIEPSTNCSEFPNNSDTVSRQEAIDAAKDWYEGLICGSINGLIKRLNALPSAQPEPQEGHWIPHETPDGGEQYECSRCGVLWEFNDGTPEDNEAYFCPKCGTKLITK